MKEFIWRNKHNTIYVKAESIEEAINMITSNYDEYLSKSRTCSEMTKKLIQYKKLYDIDGYYGDQVLCNNKLLNLSETTIPINIQNEIIYNFNYKIKFTSQFKNLMIVVFDSNKNDVINWITHVEPVILL